MKFNHVVKHNGVYYPAGADVPIENEKGGGSSPIPFNSGKVEEDLNLPYAQLKKLAKEKGLKITNTMKANELKAMLRSV